MRIISGIYKGRRFADKVPEGVRPTSDAVRETIFNILRNSYEIEGAAVIDVFAGTGAFGFEALSCGAEYCLFIEKSRKVAYMVEETAKQFSVPDEDYDVVNADAVKHLPQMAASLGDNRFDVAYLDPPYRTGVLNPALEVFAERDIIVKGGLLIVEFAVGIGIVPPKGFSMLNERTIGQTVISFFEKD